MVRQSIVLLAVVFALSLGAAHANHEAEFATSWTEQGTDALPVALRSHTALVFDDEIYVIGGTSGSTVQEKVYSSSDGTSFSEVGTDALAAVVNLHASVVFDSKMWIIGGSSGAGGSPIVDDVYHSTDGQTWTQASDFPVSIRNHAAAVFNDEIFVIGGVADDGGGAATVSTVWASSDGSSWEERGDLPEAVSSAKAIVFDGRLWLVGGGSGPHVFVSSDGASWSEAGEDALPFDLQNPAVAVASDRVWVTGGVESSTTWKDTVFSSADATNWVEIGSGPLPDGIAQHAMLLFNGRLMTIGGSVGPTAGTQTRKVYATDTAVGLSHIPQPSDTVSEFASGIPAMDQSGDTANSSLPVIGPIASQVETDTGWPVVDLVFTMIFGIIACGVAFFLAKLAPDNKLVASIGTMVVLLIGFTAGQGVIEWYSVLAIAGLFFGMNSLGSTMQG